MPSNCKGIDSYNMQEKMGQMRSILTDVCQKLYSSDWRHIPISPHFC